MNISVIIPTLNEQETIEKTLESIGNSEGTEVIVSDGGSTDKTVDLCQRYAHVINSRPGRGSQMNTGASAASGDVLLFLHADTILPENWRDSVLSAMSDENTAGGAFSLSIDSDRRSHRIIAATANVRTRITGIPYGDQGIFVRRSVFERVGGFKDIPIMEDVDLMRRLKKVGKIILLRDKVKTSGRRWEREGVVYTTLRNWLLVLFYFMGVAPERLYRLYKTVR